MLNNLQNVKFFIVHRNAINSHLWYICHNAVIFRDLRMCFFIFITTVTMKEPMVLIKVDYFNKMVTNPLLKSDPFLHHHHHFFVTSKVTIFPFNRMMKESDLQENARHWFFEEGKRLST